MEQAEENFMNNPSTIALNQKEILIANAPPRLASPDLNTRAQQRGIWNKIVAKELRSIGIIRLSLKVSIEWLESCIRKQSRKKP